MINVKIRKKKRPPVVYAFIDSQNLNMGVQKVGWKMDWRRFRQYLKNQYNVTHAYMFIGYMTEHEALYESMHEAGYLIVLKPTFDMSRPVAEPKTHETKAEDKKLIKGNIDADLVLHTMKELPKYDKAIIVSGDGDFYGLIEFLIQRGKLLHIMTPNWQYSGLLKQFEKYIIRIDQLRHKLAYHDRKKKK